MAAFDSTSANALELQDAWELPDKGTIGVIFLIVTESALFLMFVIAYIVYMGKSLSGPTPREVLEIPIVSTICLWSSSLTIYFAEHALMHAKIALFKFWWGLTILLGGEFLLSTGAEWYKLIYQDHLTISTNVFGSTFYSLVGLHASHVIVGLLFLSLVWTVTALGFPIESQTRRIKFLSWYWHFVDAIWVVVFTVVYLLGR